MHAGQLLAGRYRLVAPLGPGGMGEVWKAEDTHAPPRVVAVKGVLRDPQSVAANRRRLESEAAILAGLSHPHIVPITDRFIEGDQLYLVTQFIDGRNLQEAMKSGSLTQAAKAAVLLDVLDALAYLHGETPVVHRDLKPENILIDRRGRAYVTDFGIARSLADPGPRSAHVIGTPGYMAPEVRDGAPATAASDVWSFGAVALRLFTGRMVHEGLPEGNFAGDYTGFIRAALRIQATQRPSADELLRAFRAAQLRGAATAPTPIAPTQPHKPTGAAAPSAAGASVMRPAAPVLATGRPWWRPLLGPAIAIVVIAVLLGASSLVANALFGQPGRPPAQNAAPPVAAPPPTTESPTPTPTPSDTPTPTPSDTPTPTPTSESPSPTPTVSTPAPYSGPEWVYLASTDYIDAEIVGRPGHCTGGCTGFRLHPDSIAGTLYPQSWEMRMDGDGKKSTTTWNAYTKCTKLEATIGLSDNSQSVQARFQLQREGGATDDFGVLRTGQSKKITVDLTGTFRFTVVSYLAVPQTLDTTSAAVWGDIRMLCTGLPTTQP